MISKLVPDHRSSACVFFLIFVVSSPTAATKVNFKSCLVTIQNGSYGVFGGTDSQGHPITDISRATSITYELCVTACGAGSEPFDWSVFSQQFSSWLLPWLALVSQLPFGANDKFDNLVSMLLTVGSPVLAAYSLALTLLNGRWITRLFAPHVHNPKAIKALRVLSSLQQSPLVINTEESLLTSLILLDENEKWWIKLDDWLNFTHTWSISAVTSIFWVVIAYVFTVIDSFEDITTVINANGQAVGSLWLWLLPVVLGWLQVSPKCDSARLYHAVDRANKKAYVQTSPGNIVLVTSISYQPAISLEIPSTDNGARRDIMCTAPIYNYARLFPWVQAVETVEGIFHLAGSCALPTGNLVTVRRGSEGEAYTSPQVVAHHMPPNEAVVHKRSSYGQHVWSRICLASMLALSLQWGTTGAAIIAVWSTPTSGLGCRSLLYILYGSLSTVIWALLLLSSILAHHSTISPKVTTSSHIASGLSTCLRRCGKVFATFNSALIVASGLLQFSNFFDRCYCNSSVLEWGPNAFYVIQLSQDDKDHTKGAWIGAVSLAAATATLFIGFIILFINPVPQSTSRSV